MLKRPVRRTLLLAAAAVALTACPDGGEVAPTATPSGPAQVTATAAPPSVEPAAEHEDVRGLAVRGRNGRFTWEPFDGAASYTVVASSEDGRDVWTWTGTETSVVFGAASEEGLDLPGVGEPARRPRRGVSYHWTVIALDRDGQAIASERGEPFTCAPRCGASGS